MTRPKKPEDKRRPGRPVAKEPRRNRMMFALTDAELRWVERKSKAAGRKPALYARDVLLAGFAPPNPRRR